MKVRVPVTLAAMALLAALAPSAHAEVAVGLTTDNQLVMFDTLNAKARTSTLAISDLPGGVSILAIDFRPANGVLYGLGSNSTLYRINVATGDADSVGEPFPIDLGGLLDTDVVGFDFNPSVDRIRVVTAAGLNFRLNPESGQLAATDTVLGYVAEDINVGETPDIIGAAYTGAAIGAPTTLYVIDGTQGTLVVQGTVGGSVSPNSGQLRTVGSLGISSLSDNTSFDISSTSGAAYLAVASGADTTIHAVDLASGSQRYVGTVTRTLRGLSIAPAIVDERLTALTNNGHIVTFRSSLPGIIERDLSLVGTIKGVTFEGLDQRPSTGDYYTLGSNATLYVINHSTGVPTAVGAPIAVDLAGQQLGFDFNPVVDRIRLVSGAGGNYRLHPDTGALAATDTSLAYATGDPGFGVTPKIVGSAYTSNRAGATSTTLFGIDSERNSLVRQGSELGTPASPNGGILTTIGGLNVDIDGHAGFDISGSSGLAYVGARTTGYRDGDGAFLHRIDLSTGQATPVGLIGNGIAIRGLTVDSAASTISTSAFASLNSTQWESGTAVPVIDAPVFSESGGLGLEVGSSPANTFGYFQTRTLLDPLPAGTYRIRFNLELIPGDSGTRYPEIRFRAFAADNSSNRIVGVANVGSAPYPTTVDLYWKSDGVTPWRIAADILSFVSDQDGGVRIRSITVVQSE